MQFMHISLANVTPTSSCAAIITDVVPHAKMVDLKVRIHDSGVIIGRTLLLKVNIVSSSTHRGGTVCVNSPTHLPAIGGYRS